MGGSSSPAPGAWRAKMTLEYDGSAFAGSQFQPGQRTVQGVVEAAVQHITGQEQRIALAGRTDAGVHALGQVASALLPMRFAPADAQRALNALLPEDVAVVDVARMRPDFHARFCAEARYYAYHVWNAPWPSPLHRGTAWHVRSGLDDAAMAAAATSLVGDHDFASFAGAGRGVPGGANAGATRRTITSASVQVVESLGAGRLLRLNLSAPSFLPHMVRNIASALVAVGLSRWTTRQFADVLRAADRRQSTETAPPHGVMLLGVIYAASWYDQAIAGAAPAVGHL